VKISSKITLEPNVPVLSYTQQDAFLMQEKLRNHVRTPRRRRFTSR
jgi:hypothetical protein